MLPVARGSLRFHCRSQRGRPTWSPSWGALGLINKQANCMLGWLCWRIQAVIDNPLSSGAHKIDDFVAVAVLNCLLGSTFVSVALNYKPPPHSQSCCLYIYALIISLTLHWAHRLGLQIIPAYCIQVILIFDHNEPQLGRNRGQGQEVCA